ncbi:MAG: hypothetical protein NZ926_00890 [Candidatus Methanomethylicia archaeon]|nr:hypothetical protein [Candidatus Methanomethylicia archaeon]MCX8168987.1 hypothetical protein [Candidatus Methanomethylicia archaeon]MDW7988719.1 hypothetical protein [Nitrososphaerota archaeon]
MFNIKEVIFYGITLSEELGIGSIVRLKLEIPNKFIGSLILISNYELSFHDPSGKFIINTKLPMFSNVLYVVSLYRISRSEIYIFFHNVNGKIYIYIK